MPRWTWLCVIGSGALHTVMSLGPSKDLVSWLCPCISFTSETSGESSRFSAEKGLSLSSLMWPEQVYQDQVLRNKLSVELSLWTV